MQQLFHTFYLNHTKCEIQAYKWKMLKSDFLHNGIVIGFNL